MEARRPVTFGGLGEGADGPACRAALRAASTELEQLLLHGLLAGAMWTVARVSGHGMRANAACPHYGAAHEDEAHVLWDCPEWGDARGTWLPWRTTRRGPSPAWALRTGGPLACGKRAFSPFRLAHGVDRDLLDEFLYRLYGMYLAVLAARLAASTGDQPGHGDSLFPEQPRPRPRDPYPWDAFIGPIPGDVFCHQPRLQPGVPADWRWPQDFIHDLIRWARALAWAPGPAEVSWAELALDYEAFVGRALPASPDHRLRGTRLPLGERSQVLRKPVGQAERHLAAAALRGGAQLGRCRSLLHLGGRVCAGLSARPYFAARHEVMLQLMRPEAHCCDSWARRMRAPGRMRPQHSDRFLMDYFPRPLEPPPPPPASVCPAAPAGSGPRRPSRGAAAQPPPKCGQWHAGRALLGAWGAVVCPMQEPGLEYQPLLPS